VRRKLFGHKRDVVTGEWRRLRNENICMQRYSPNIIRVIKSRRIRWAGHVARMGDRRASYRVLVGIFDERDQLEDFSIGGRIILKWMFKK
jgi:hypothetical protein